uniref:Uncharacterized protein n=1 Tax=Noccaea caerulescens TaxID=107243 RepID=A0A1J3I6Z7_NOCCA
MFRPKHHLRRIVVTYLFTELNRHDNDYYGIRTFVRFDSTKKFRVVSHRLNIKNLEETTQRGSLRLFEDKKRYLINKMGSNQMLCLVSYLMY